MVSTRDVEPTEFTKEEDKDEEDKDDEVPEVSVMVMAEVDGFEVNCANVGAVCCEV